MHGSLKAFNKTLARKVPPTLYLMEVSHLEKVTYLVDLGNTMPCENAMQVFTKEFSKLHVKYSMMSHM